MNPKNSKKGKSKLMKIIVIASAVLLVLAVVILMLRKQVTAKFGAEASGDIESAKVTVGSISATVTGSGTLADEDVDDIELPVSVELDEIVVSAGDKIKEGDLLATVDMTTVLTAMNELQDSIDEYDDEIGDAVSNAVGNAITSPVSGRVKAVYCAYGDDVSRVMYDKGALMVLSIDGYMAVDIPAEALAAGDAVSVKKSDGTVLDGKVSDINGDTAVVTVTDELTKLDESVSVLSASGEELGSGELYIHKPLKITGFAGTVSACYCDDTTYVYPGTRLVYLSDTEYSANYDALLKERDELEEQLRQLVAIYKEGALYSHMSGSVASVASDDDEETETDTQVVMSICPDETMTVTLSVDETDILSLSVGQEAEISVSSVGEDSFTGTLTKLETAGTSSGGVTYYSAVITLPKAEKMLSGMTANVTIRIEGVDNALIIPSDALHQTSSSSFVYTGYDADTGEFTGMTEVTVGMNNGSYAEISSGLKEGDTVYYEPKEETDFFRPMSGDFPSGGGMPSGGFPSGGFPSGGGGGMPSGGFPSGGGMPRG